MAVFLASMVLKRVEPITAHIPQKLLSSARSAGSTIWTKLVLDLVPLGPHKVLNTVLAQLSLNCPYCEPGACHLLAARQGETGKAQDAD